ncbi:MAG: hypothetical protein JWO46_38, partial [Nocardioidaceae bacterium]|nr:hypothetical protein [Nocardioidaceae bacterium]
NDLDSFETALLADLRETVTDRVSRRRRRRGITLAAAAVAAVVGATAVVGFFPSGSGPLAPQRAAAATVLTQAARAAADAPASSGTYWYTHSETDRPISRTKTVHQDLETWQRQDGASWWRLKGEELKRDKETSAFLLCDKLVGYDVLAALPTEPVALGAALRDAMEHNDDGPVPADAQSSFLTGCAISLLGLLPAPPAVRAATFRFLATQPGAQNLGPAKDARGRSGTELRFGKDTVVIDQRTGLVLQTNAGEGGPVVMVTARWTDQLG